MNANTRLRLWKETRALLPIWAPAVILMIGSGLIGAAFENRTALVCHMLTGIGGCWLLGAVSVGHEFDHRTLGLLLGQPVSRSRLWAEKMLVLSVAVGTLWWSASIVSWFGCGYGVPSGEAVSSSAAILAIAVCSAPVLTLFARSTIGGVALTLVGPLVLLLVTVAISTWVTIYRVENNLIELTHPKAVVEIDHTYFLAALLMLYCGGLAWFGWRKFVRWEENQAASSQIALPASVARLLDGVRGRVSLGLHSAWGSLLRKELGIQQPTFLVALGFMVMWLALQAAMFISPTLNKGFLLLPVVLLGLGIPVIAGIVSTAEERSLGLLDWHLTLPVSARRQWFVKVLVALAVNVVLGILLPGVLAQASGGLLEGKHMELGLQNGEQHFLIANAVIFCAALYASTASANSMRALVGTIVLLVAGAMVLNFADYLASGIPKHTSWTQHNGDGTVSYHYPSGLSDIVHRYGWLLGWSCLAVWLYFLGLAGFRRSLESFWRPVRRMAVFFAVVCAFVFAAIVW